MSTAHADALQLVFLCRAEVQLAEPLRLAGSPIGTRVIAEARSFRLDRERIRASLKGTAAADWLVVSPDGTFGCVDVRAAVVTDDGASIYLQYNGRIRFPAGGGLATVYVAPRFETGDARYAWLNQTLAVGKGLLDRASGRLAYTFYELE